MSGDDFFDKQNVSQNGCTLDGNFNISNTSQTEALVNAFLERNPIFNDLSWQNQSGQNIAGEIYKSYLESGLQNKEQFEQDLVNYASVAGKNKDIATPADIHDLAKELYARCGVENGTHYLHHIISPLQTYGAQPITGSFVEKICHAYCFEFFPARFKKDIFNNILTLIKDERFENFSSNYDIDIAGILATGIMWMGWSIDSIHETFNLLEAINRTDEEKRDIVQTFFSVAEEPKFASFDDPKTDNIYRFLPKIHISPEDQAVIKASTEISYPFSIKRARILCGLLNNDRVELTKDMMTTEGLNKAWLDDGKKYLVRKNIIDSYNGTTQAELDSRLRELSIKYRDYDKDLTREIVRFCSHVTVKDYTNEEALACLKVILGENELNPRTVYSLIHRRDIREYSSLINVIEHVAGRLPVDEHIRILEDYLSYEKSENKADLELKITEPLSHRTLSDLEEIIALTTPSNAPIYIAEMLSYAKKGDPIAERLSFLRNLCQCEKDNPLFKDLMISICDDITLGKKDDLIKKALDTQDFSLQFYLEQSQKSLTKKVLKQIKAIGNHYQGSQKEIIEYNLAQLARNHQKEIGSIIRSLKSILDIKQESQALKKALEVITPNESSSSKKDMITIEELVFSLVHKTAYPDSVCQAGPTCGSVAIEYYLKTRMPAKYLAYMSWVINKIQSGKYTNEEFNLTPFDKYFEPDRISCSTTFTHIIFHNKNFNSSHSNYHEGRAAFLKELKLNAKPYDREQSLSKVWRSAKVILRDINSALRNGEFVMVDYSQGGGGHTTSVVGTITHNGKIAGYLLFQAWPMTLKNGRYEVMSVERFRQTIIAAVIIDKPQDKKKITRIKY